MLKNSEFVIGNLQLLRRELSFHKGLTPLHPLLQRSNLIDRHPKAGRILKRLERKVL